MRGPTAPAVPGLSPCVRRWEAPCPGGGSCAPPGPAAAPTPISCTPGRGLGWAGGRGWGHRSCPVLIGDGGAGGPGSVPAAGMERRPTGRAARHPARPPAGGGAGGPEGRGAAGPANNPPSSLSAPCLRCGCATVGRSWGRREPSAAGRGGEPRGGGGVAALPLCSPVVERTVVAGAPRGLRAALRDHGCGNRGSCELRANPQLRVRPPPPATPPGGGQRIRPRIGTRGAPAHPPHPGAGFLPGAAGSQPQPPRPPQPPSRAPTCQIKRDSPRGNAQRHFQG